MKRTLISRVLADLFDPVVTGTYFVPDQSRHTLPAWWRVLAGEVCVYWNGKTRLLLLVRALGVVRNTGGTSWALTDPGGGTIVLGPVVVWKRARIERPPAPPPALPDLKIDTSWTQPYNFPADFKL